MLTKYKNKGIPENKEISDLKKKKDLFTEAG